MATLREPPVPWGDDGHPERQRCRRRTINVQPCSRDAPGDHARGVRHGGLVRDRERSGARRRRSGRASRPGIVHGGPHPPRDGGSGTRPARRPRRAVASGRPSARPGGRRATGPSRRTARRISPSRRRTGEPGRGRDSSRRAPGAPDGVLATDLGAAARLRGRGDAGVTAAGGRSRARLPTRCWLRAGRAGGASTVRDAELECRPGVRERQCQVGRARSPAARFRRTSCPARPQRGGDGGGASPAVAGDRTAGLPGLTATRPATWPACALERFSARPQFPRSNG